MFMRVSLRRGDVNDVIYDAEYARDGRYGCTRGTIRVHVKADMGSREWAVKGFGITSSISPGNLAF